MIASLRGKAVLVGANRIILDVNGVGYSVTVSLMCLEMLGRSDEAFLHISTIVRENAIELYGFTGLEEKTIFEMLLGVSGVGPKTALAIISGLPPEEFKNAVISENSAGLSSLPGIGKKTAARIIIELQEKVRKLKPEGAPGTQASIPENLEADLVSSLVNLGYKDRTAAAAAAHVLKSLGKDISLADAVRAALRDLMKQS
jgi:holliday junction DNA helicase RuvA